jgi:hypothetical protein
MQFSLLHLSDLHRDLSDEIPNAWLIDSLERDIEGLGEEDLKVPKPSICIVSGDLVYGVHPDFPEAELELQRQNQQSLEFLTELAAVSTTAIEIGLSYCRATMTLHLSE